MKKLLILLSLCVLVIACGNMRKPAMDVVGDMMTPTEEEPFAGVPRITVSDAFMQDKITGPWLWMAVPTEPSQGGPGSIDIDSLAVTSDGAVTEMDVATNGAFKGNEVGDLAWTLGTISATDQYNTHGGNVNKTLNEIGLAEGRLDDYSAYALINVVSDMDQSDLIMKVGSDDSIKVWLNGEVVHNNPIIRAARAFQDEFKVDLKMGDNLLLVKVSERAGGWTMFVGIEDPSKPTEEPTTDVGTPEETVEVAPPSDGAIVSIAPAEIVSPAVGVQLTVDIHIAGASNVAGYEVRLEFDPTALRYVSSAYADYLPPGAFVVAIDATVSANSVTFAIQSTDAAVTDSGALATVTFEVIVVKASTLQLTNVVLADNTGYALPVSTQDGIVTAP